MKKASPLLAAMGKAAAHEEERTEAALLPEPVETAAKSSGKRVGQKHLGAYFDKRVPILEQVAILRAAGHD